MNGSFEDFSNHAPEERRRFIGINDNQREPLSTTMADSSFNDNFLEDSDEMANNQRRQPQRIVLMTNNQIMSKELLQQKLLFYFMSPIDKWRTKFRFPFKLVFQLLKIVFVTFQLVNFGNEMSTFLTQDDHIRNAFRNILLDDWDQTREVVAYPPATGDYAVYTTDHFYSSLDFAIKKYSNVTKLSIGAFGFEHKNYPSVIFMKSSFKKRDLDPSIFSYSLDPNERLHEVLNLKELYPSGDPKWYEEFSTKKFFHENNFTIGFETLIKLHVVFPLRTILFEGESPLGRCFDLNVTMVYDNHGHDAMIKVKLKLSRFARLCHYLKENFTSNLDDNLMMLVESSPGINPSSTLSLIMVLNYTVIIFCTISTMLCIRSLYRGQMLRRETQQYFRNFYCQELSLDDQMEFIDIGLLMICLNDLLIIGGTIMKIRMESSDSAVDSSLYTNCSLFLGVGNLLVWLGLLRYFSYFKSYNILVVTIKKSMPNVLRFCLCAFLLYGGFCFCGWVVLGPHHLKFRTLSSTLECLFSLMNGDDMFATFFSTDVKKSSLIWWFSRIYLYLFISLSIYVIVSLFIAIILDAYESVRDSYTKMNSGNNLNNKSNLQRFIEEFPMENFDGRLFHNDSIADQIQSYFRSCFFFNLQSSRADSS